MQAPLQLTYWMGEVSQDSWQVPLEQTYPPPKGGWVQSVPWSPSVQSPDAPQKCVSVAPLMHSGPSGPLQSRRPRPQVSWQLPSKQTSPSAQVAPPVQPGPAPQ